MCALWRRPRPARVFAGPNNIPSTTESYHVDAILSPFCFIFHIFYNIQNNRAGAGDTSWTLFCVWDIQNEKKTSIKRQKWRKELSIQRILYYIIYIFETEVLQLMFSAVCTCTELNVVDARMEKKIRTIWCLSILVYVFVSLNKTTTQFVCEPFFFLSSPFSVLFFILFYFW